jgi:sugar/nucleoside kinase (ribokinase family)
VSASGIGWAGRWLRATSTPSLLVVGGASLDRIHVKGEPVRTPGGAGLYTALAAARAGANVTMLAPLPDPMPAELAPALELIHWVGPSVPPDALPRFEIAYDGAGTITLFREHLGAEPEMTPALLDLVADMPSCAYCVPFMDAGLQRLFVDALRARGCLTIGSTYGKAAGLETDLVRSTLSLTDLSFCNSDEAQLLYGDDASPPPGRLRFVTRGSAGVTVYQGDHRTDLAGLGVDVVDPTGAGDTFCGTTVARLLLGEHPVEAARRGNAAAAETVTAIGPTTLWQRGRPPLPRSDERASVDADVVDRLAELVAGMDELQGFDFTGDLFPAVGDEHAIAWFAAATLQQFGFWYSTDGHWNRSMIATVDGTVRKGSDYLWAVFQRWFAEDPESMMPHVQAATTIESWHARARDDDGIDPFPQPDLCVDLAAAYGRTLGELDLTAAELVSIAGATSRPLRSLLTLLDHVGGYREDPLRKKSALLGVILCQRPEQFLPPVTQRGSDDAPPIVDYHVQRTCLRTGMVTIADEALASKVRSRQLLDEAEEWAVRRAAFDAVARLCERSGRTMGAVDWFLFQMRHRCPEVATPVCSECPANLACGHHVELFQPVRRTTFY